MGFNISTNMNLPIPQVGNEAGPQYAQDVNNCLTLVDQHNHTSGNGVPIPSSGLNINSDLPMNNNNLISARSVRFFPQLATLSTPTDLGCLYETGVDLYFNDGVGNQVRITQSGGIAGTPGSISNLTPPASASYVAGNFTFVWQSNANTPANLDAASIVLRNLVANSKGLTLNPPGSMASDFSITLPSVPVQTNILTMDPSGIIGAVLNVDNSTLDISANLIEVKNQGITQGKLALRATGSTVAAGGIATSTSVSGSFVTTSPTTIASVTITTTGRPVQLGLLCGNTSPGAISGFEISGTNAQYNVEFQNGSTIINGRPELRQNDFYTPGSFTAIDFPVAGTYTYNLVVYQDQVVSGFQVDNIVLFAYEL